MYLSQIGRNTVTACGCCDLLISNKLENPREALEKLCDQLQEHLEQNSGCKSYYDALPNLMDLRGILRRVEESGVEDEKGN